MLSNFVFVFSLIFSLTSFADNHGTRPMKAMGPMSGMGPAAMSPMAAGKNPIQSPACAAAKAACEKAGFKLGDHKKNGKGLIVDCIGKMARGEKVAGVNVPDDANWKVCRAMIHGDQRMKNEMKGMTPMGPMPAMPMGKAVMMQKRKKMKEKPTPAPTPAEEQDMEEPMEEVMEEGDEA